MAKKPLALSHGITDHATQQAVRQLEQILAQQDALFTATTPGIVPASGGGTEKFLRADATWAVPAGSVSLPIAESDVTGLVSDLAGKVPATRSVLTTAGQLTGGGDLSADRTLGLADTAVTPGTYTSANITVDQKGRITAAASGGGGAADVLSVTRNGLGNAIAAYTVNCSTEGTVDWFAPVSAPNQGGMWGRTNSGTPPSHEKLHGPGWLQEGTTIALNACAYNTLGPFNGGTSDGHTGVALKRTTAADDDLASAVLSADGSYNGFGATALNTGGRGPGFRIRVPALAKQYVMRVYTDQRICTVSCYAQIVGRTTAPVTVSSGATANPSAGGIPDDGWMKNQWVITYSAAEPAALEVLFLITAIPGSLFGATPGVALSAVTIAES